MDVAGQLNAATTEGIIADASQVRINDDSTVDKEVKNLNVNTGISEYETFSDAKAYSAGDTVMYNGQLYQFTADHAAGAWTGTDAEGTNLIKTIDVFNKDFYKIQSSLCKATNDGYTYYPFVIRKGVTYNVRVKRTNYVNSTIQFFTFANHYGGTLIDTLEWLVIDTNDTSFSFTATENANYVGTFSSKPDAEILLIFDSTTIVKDIEDNKDNISSEISRATAEENKLNTKIDDTNNKLIAKQTRHCISNLINPNNVISSNYWFLTDTMIVKDSTVTFASFISISAGTSVIGLWKYENNTLELMETFSVTASSANETVVINELLNRHFDYNCFISASNDVGVTGCIGIQNNTQNRIYFSKENRTIVGTTVNFTDTLTYSGALCMRITYAININNSPTETTNQGILEVGANKMYKTIQEAVNVANSGNTILIYPGTYDEQIQAVSKTIHLIGVDKYTCIIRDRSSNYYTPPIEIQSGSICNLTIIETDDMPTEGLDDIIISGTGLSAKNMAYCIHADWNNYDTYKNLYIHNCIIRNQKRPCIGAGLHENQQITISNCVLYSGNSDEGKDRGAVYCHAATDGADQQYLNLYHNIIECADKKAMEIRGYSGGHMYIKALGNTIYSNVDGKADSIINQNFGTGLHLLAISSGNNVNILNA